MQERLSASERRGVAAAFATACLAFCVWAFPDMSRIVTIPGALICLVLTIYFLWPEITALCSRPSLQGRLRRMWPQYLMVLGACLFFVGLIAFFQTGAENPGHTEPHPTKFSWVWEPLTAGEIEKISSQLRSSGRENITLAFNARTAGKLAASFTQIFERAEWGVKSIGPASYVYTGGITGLGQYPNNTTGRSLKAAIESYSKLQVSFVGLRYVPETGASMLIIGAKPPPSPLPPELQKELSELGKKTSDLGASLILFSSDRAIDEAKLPSREFYGPGIDGVNKYHNERVAFSNRTKALLSQRFQQLDYFLGQLELMGIERPFFVQSTDSPAVLGKWLQMMGQFLENGGVEEARMKGADNDFWSKQ